MALYHFSVTSYQHCWKQLATVVTQFSKHLHDSGNQTELHTIRIVRIIGLRFRNV